MHHRHQKRISREAARLLISYDWPGSVRHLRNVMERLTITVQDDTNRPADLPPSLQFRDTTGKLLAFPLGRLVAEPPEGGGRQSRPGDRVTGG